MRSRLGPHCDGQTGRPSTAGGEPHPGSAAGIFRIVGVPEACNVLPSVQALAAIPPLALGGAIQNRINNEPAVASSTFANAYVPA